MFISLPFLFFSFSRLKIIKSPLKYFLFKHAFTFLDFPTNVTHFNGFLWFQWIFSDKSLLRLMILTSELNIIKISLFSLICRNIRYKLKITCWSWERWQSRKVRWNLFPSHTHQGSHYSKYNPEDNLRTAEQTGYTWWKREDRTEKSQVAELPAVGTQALTPSQFTSGRDRNRAERG